MWHDEDDKHIVDDEFDYEDLKWISKLTQKERDDEDLDYFNFLQE